MCSSGIHIKRRFCSLCSYNVITAITSTVGGDCGGWFSKTLDFNMVEVAFPTLVCVVFPP